MLNTNFQSIKK